MFPHYFGSDFSAALPWTIMGFIVGALFIALTRLLSGGGRQVRETIQGLHDQLSAARLEASKLTSDNGFLNTALADAERRAAEGGRLAQANFKLSQADAELRGKTESLVGELDRARQDLETYNARGSNLEAEVQRLKAENASLKSSWDNNARQFNAMRSDLAAAEARIRDFDLVRNRLEEAQAELHKSGAVHAELEKARFEIQSLRVIAEQAQNLQQDNARLKASLSDTEARLSAADAAASNAQRAHANDGAIVAAEQEIARLKGALNEAHAQLKDLDATRANVQRLIAERDALKTAAAQGAGGSGVELDRVRADLAAANAALAAAKSDLDKAAKAQSLVSGGGGVPTADFNALMVDLNATRNLSIVQAKELQHLRSEVARLASEIASDVGDRGASAGETGGRYAERQMVNNRPISALRQKVRGWRTPDTRGMESELRSLRTRVEQLSTEADELRRLSKRDS